MTTLPSRYSQGKPLSDRGARRPADPDSPPDRRPGSRPFAALPHDIAGNPAIDPTAKAVLLALLFWARDRAECWPSDPSIAARIGRSPGTVQRALRRLEVLGLVERRKAPPGHNPTGRVIVLRWRATPPAPASDPPAPAAREEGRRSEKEPGRGESCPGTGTPPAGDVRAEQLVAWAEGDDPILRRIGRAALGWTGEGPAARANDHPGRGRGSPEPGLEALEPAGPAVAPDGPPSVARREAALNYQPHSHTSHDILSSAGRPYAAPPVTPGHTARR